MSNLSAEELALALLAAVFGCGLLVLGLKTFGGGLLAALRLSTGRWPTRTIAGTLDLIGRIKSDDPRYDYCDLRFTAADSGRAFTCGRMRLGRTLHTAGALAAGLRGVWLVSAGRFTDQSVKDVKLLGFTDGQYIYHSDSDLADLFHFSSALALLAGVVSLFLANLLLRLNGLMLPLPVFVQKWSGPITIACGLLPFAVLMLIYRRARKKMAAVTKEALQNLALDFRAKASAPERKKPTAAPPVSCGNDLGQVMSIIGLAMPLSVVLAPLIWLVKLVIMMTSVWAAPRFELRSLSIIKSGRPTRDFSGRVIYDHLILTDSTSAVEKKAHWVLAAETLAINGLLTGGASGFWLIPEGPANRFAGDQPLRELVLGGFYDEESGLVYNPADVLKLYRYNAAAPWLAALLGLAVGLGLLLSQTGAAFHWPEALWLLPAALAPYFLLKSAQKRILSAAEEAFKRHLPASLLLPPGRGPSHGS